MKVIAIRKLHAFFKKQRLALFFVVMYVLLYIWREQILDWVVPFLSLKEWLYTSVLLAFICVPCYAFWLSSKWYISQGCVVSLLFLFSGSLYVWVYGDRQLSTLFGLYTETCIVLLLVQAWTKYFEFFAKEELKGNDNPVKVLLRDHPVADDDYKRENLARHVVSSIISDSQQPADCIQQAFVINIDEGYGRGKSSFFLLLKGALDKRNVGYFDFSPWLCSSSEKVIKDFFGQLESYLAPMLYLTERKILRAFVKQWLESSVQGKFIPSSCVLNQKGLSEQYVELQEMMRTRVRRPIVVFVDDVDRLQSDELLTVLSLIRNVASLPYLYFIMAADLNYVKNTLADDVKDKGDIGEYLKKIINLNLYFPQVEESFVMDSFCRMLEESLQLRDEIDSDSCQQIVENCTNIFRSYPQVRITDVFRSYRDLKRFFSVLRMDLVSHHCKDFNTDVLFGDFLELELIKFLDSDVYKMLREKPSCLLETRVDSNIQIYIIKNGIRDKISHVDVLDGGKINLKDNEMLEAISLLHLDKSEKMKNAQVFFLYRLLQNLFRGGYDSERSMCVVANYDNYFSTELRSDQITYSQFMEFWGKNPLHLNDFFNSAKLPSFYMKLREAFKSQNMIGSSVSNFEKLLDYVCQASKMRKNPLGSTGSILTEFDKFRNEFDSNVLDLIPLYFAKDYFPDEELKKAMLKYFKSTNGDVTHKMLLYSSLYRGAEYESFTKDDFRIMRNNVQRHFFKFYMRIQCPTDDFATQVQFMRERVFVNSDLTPWCSGFVKFLLSSQFGRRYMLDCWYWDKDRNMFVSREFIRSALFPKGDVCLSILMRQSGNKEIADLAKLIANNETLSKEVISQYPFMNDVRYYVQYL